MVCPGTNISSLRSSNSVIDKQNKRARVGTQYFSLSGASMATPVCADIAALILEANEGLMSAKVKNKLKDTTRPLIGIDDENIQGKGLADAEETTK